MIKRIQTVFLFLAAAAAFGLFKLPFATTSGQVEASFFADLDYDIQDHIALIIIFTVAGVAALVGIFLFNNRPLQMKCTRFAILVNLVGLALAVIFFLQADNPANKSGVGVQLGAFAPILFLIFGILALRYIRKDEKLVRSMDRLR